MAEKKPKKTPEWKTAKAWKSTAECCARIREMRAHPQFVTLHLKNDDDTGGKWQWEIAVLNPHPHANIHICPGDCFFMYEDEAANAAYRWAHRHLRPKKRRKKGK